MAVSRLMAAAVALLVVAAGEVYAEDDDAAAELKAVQGRFERFFQNAAGVRFRAVRDVGQGQSVVTTYDDAGNMVASHTSEFKLEKRGPVRVFSFFNLTVLAGPNKGHTQPGTSSYIYRADGKNFAEVWGMLEADPREPVMIIWRKVEESK